MIEIIIEFFGQLALELSGDNKISKPVRLFLVSIVFIPLTVLFIFFGVKMFLANNALLGMIFAVFSLISIGVLIWLCQKIYKRK